MALKKRVNKMLINLQTHLYNMIIYMLLNVLSLIRIDSPIYSDLFKFFFVFLFSSAWMRRNIHENGSSFFVSLACIGTDNA